MRRARAGSCCATPTAARCRTRSRPSSARWSRAFPANHRRHPRPQRHRAGGGEFVRRRPRRRPPDPGHAQRPRRALRQRQSRVHHPDAEAEARVCRSIRDRRLRRQAEKPRSTSRTRSTSGSTARRTATRPTSATAPSPPRPASTPPPSSRTPPPTSTSRRRRSATAASSWSRTRPAAPTCWPSSSASGSRSTRTISASRRLLDEVKEREAIGYAYETADASFELLARRMLGTVPKFFDVSYFDVKVEQRGQNGTATRC